ncbi:MAG: nucleotidyltransferase domain-containing protein [Zoogloeaceae bacterium]|jgi:predicted nucleotidyltransferase|nr:nucleotidyltransferase domain-containing protein [Zoogloeaceae bacterium]
MISEDIRTEILRRLGNVETEHSVHILFATESGSRAWGFASPNSDYDVRFIYMREPGWYQAVDLEERRDVIEYPIVDDIDLNGWDVRKALRLFWKSNPTFVEWIQSPLTYVDQSLFRKTALALLPEIYSPEKGIYHYRSMAKTNYRGYLKEPVVPLKKYFYILRPLLAARWIASRGCAAPIEFEKLLTLLHKEPVVLAEVHKLLKQKRGTLELGLAPAVPSLNAFIEAELEGGTVDIPQKSRAPMVVDRLNELFHRVLEECRANNSFNPDAPTVRRLT